jgi:hypothetical protein
VELGLLPATKVGEVDVAAGRCGGEIARFNGESLSAKTSPTSCAIVAGRLVTGCDGTPVVP